MFQNSSILGSLTYSFWTDGIFERGDGRNNPSAFISPGSCSCCFRTGYISLVSSVSKTRAFCGKVWATWVDVMRRVWNVWILALGRPMLSDFPGFLGRIGSLFTKLFRHDNFNLHNHCVVWQLIASVPFRAGNFPTTCEVFFILRQETQRWQEQEFYRRERCCGPQSLWSREFREFKWKLGMQRTVCCCPAPANKARKITQEFSQQEFGGILWEALKLPYVHQEDSAQGQPLQMWTCCFTWTLWSHSWVN